MMAVQMPTAAWAGIGLIVVLGLSLVAMYEYGNWNKKD